MTINFSDIASMMETGDSFKLYSARIEATDPDRIKNLCQQINDQIDKQGAPASTCCFMLKALEKHEVSMNEIADLCDFFQKIYAGDIIWGYENSTFDDLILLDVIG